MFTSYPIPTQREAKIVWRMTGSGAIALEAIGPQGERISPEWGPEPHTGSNWNRPGDEWGTGFRFPAAGCWNVQVTRDDSVATVGILVVAP